MVNQIYNSKAGWNYKLWPMKLLVNPRTVGRSGKRWGGKTVKTPKRIMLAPRSPGKDPGIFALLSGDQIQLQLFSLILLIIAYDDLHPQEPI